MTTELQATHTDRIEKRVLLKASRTRVWQALSDAEQFGDWFGVSFDGPFVPGQALNGKITTPGYEHLTMSVWVETIEPERFFAFRWHPYAIDPNVDYASEPTTLVAFSLAEAAEGIWLTITESGFDQLPAHRRAEAFRMNDGGWSEQCKRIARHVDHA